MFKDFVPIEVMMSLPCLNRDWQRARWSMDINLHRYVFETIPNYEAKCWWEWRLIHVFNLSEYKDTN